MADVEMVERVARALWNAESVRATDRPRRSEWADESEKTQESWRYMARAAIEALREPTEVIMRAHHVVPDDADYKERIADNWRALIDAILKEE